MTYESVVSHLISLEEIARDLGVTIDAVRKRYTNNKNANFPKPKFTRPTRFIRSEVERYFGKE